MWVGVRWSTSGISWWKINQDIKKKKKNWGKLKIWPTPRERVLGHWQLNYNSIIIVKKYMNCLLKDKEHWPTSLGCQNIPHPFCINNLFLISSLKLQWFFWQLGFPFNRSFLICGLCVKTSISSSKRNVSLFFMAEEVSMCSAVALSFFQSMW